MRGFVVLAMVLGLVSSCDPSLFNVFVYGNMNCSNSDTEGRIAAGGVVTLTNYAVNCLTYQFNTTKLADHQCIDAGTVPCDGKYKNDEPGLVAGRATLKNVNVYAGKTVYGTTLDAKDSKLGGSSCKSFQNPVYPATVKLSFIVLKLLSTLYNTYDPSGTTKVTYFNNKQQAQILLESVNKWAIFTVNAADLSIATDVVLKVPATAKLVLVNVQGTSVSLKNFGMNSWEATNAVTLWNFAQATSLSIQNIGFRGSMLAPQADIKTANGALWGQIWAQSLNAIGEATCAQVNHVPFKGSFPPPPTPPPAGICGDGKTDVGEDCDGGICCSATCTFLTSTTTCRPSAGSCDIPETCSGSYANCPNDVFKPVTEVCGSNFGVCDVQMFEHCPGNAATCKTAPPAYLWDWDAFNVVSFDKYTCFGGDVEGRLAVKNLLNVSGFTIGLKTVDTDPFSYYELVVGDHAVYTDGSVHSPDGTPEVAIGGTFDAPDYLQAIRDLSPGSSVLGKFDEAQTYFTTISNKIASLGTNAAATIMYGDGLQLTCKSSEALYIVQVDGATFNQVNWYYTIGCKANAAWLITITGNNDISFRGGAFPGIVERVVYNVVGQRTVSANNGVNGNIIAPQANYVQSQGVTYGKVIVGNVIEARQNNKPNCLNFKGYTITQKNLIKVNAGDDFIYVFDLDSYAVGDKACVNGECIQIIGGKTEEVEGKKVKVMVLATAVKSDVAEGTDITTVVTDTSDAARSNTIPIENESSSASVLAVSVALTAAALLL